MGIHMEQEALISFPISEGLGTVQSLPFSFIGTRHKEPGLNSDSGIGLGQEESSSNPHLDMEFIG